MSGNTARRRAADLKLVEENQHMLPEIRAKLSQRLEKLPEPMLQRLDRIVVEEPITVAIPTRSKRKSFKRALQDESMDIEMKS